MLKASSRGNAELVQPLPLPNEIALYLASTSPRSSSIPGLSTLNDTHEEDYVVATPQPDLSDRQVMIDPSFASMYAPVPSNDMDAHSDLDLLASLTQNNAGQSASRGEGTSSAPAPTPDDDVYVPIDDNEPSSAPRKRARRSNSQDEGSASRSKDPSASKKESHVNFAHIL